MLDDAEWFYHDEWLFSLKLSDVEEALMKK